MGIGHIATTVIVAIIGLSISLGVLNAVSQRLLQARIGTIRTVLAALAGLGAEFGFESQVIWPQSAPATAFVPVQIGVFLVAITFLVSSEFVVPTGTWPRPDKWVGVLRGKPARSRRYSQILRIAARHRLLAPPRPGKASGSAVTTVELGRSLRLTLREAGIAFVKLGQQLSTRRDLLADSRDREIVTGWLHLAALAFLGGMTGLMATLLLGTTTGPRLSPTMTLFQLFGYLLIVLSAIPVLRVLFDIFRTRRHERS